MGATLVFERAPQKASWSVVKLALWTVENWVAVKVVCLVVEKDYLSEFLMAVMLVIMWEIQRVVWKEMLKVDQLVRLSAVWSAAW